MSEEEKQAIENVKKLSIILDKTNEKGKSKEGDNIRIVLSLIEKQQKEIKVLRNIVFNRGEIIEKQEKEIENLKEELKIQSVVDLEEYSKKDLISVLGKEYISKDVIKAKIKQLEDELRITEDLLSGSVNSYILKGQIYLLKKLLEKP